jgi:hypothetical protein
MGSISTSGRTRGLRVAMNALRLHYPEYLMEAAGLGLFMISAAVFTTLLEPPASPMREAISDPLLRRFLIGVAMGLTAIASRNKNTASEIIPLQ